MAIPNNTIIMVFDCQLAERIAIQNKIVISS